MNPYLRFAAMIATSIVVMYFATYLNSYQIIGHAGFSETRVFMAIIMGACMAVIMLTFMLGMHKNRWLNMGIYFGSAALFALSLWLVRTQTTVDDVDYMEAMIPHHSIAILTSERANISDPRVRRLADEIIAAQRREIAEMKVLIDDIDRNGKHTARERETATQMLLGPKVPPPDASKVEVPDGFRAEVVVSGLTYPTSVEFDDDGAMYIAEAGYSYGDELPAPRILRVSPEGQIETLVQGNPLVGPLNDLLWHDGRLFISHRGKISVLAPDGEMRDLVTGLPSDGDHHNNQMTVGPDGKIYFGQGTLTNSGVVGEDNFKMGWLRKHPNSHDIPARDITLAAKTYETPNPLNTKGEKVQTSAFHPFGEAGDQGPEMVQGQTKAGGTILRMNPDGSELEVYAWGLRNPFGVMWSPDGTLYATENGCDVRGSRPIANDQEDVYVIREGAWYGWPDYVMGLPVTDPRFKPKDKPQPQFVMAEHPPVEQPWLNFPKHSAIAKLDVSNSEAFGNGYMFVAFFGHMSPMTGEAPQEHGGHRVVRIDPASKDVETFFRGKSEHGGHSASQGSAETKTPKHKSTDAGAHGGGSGDGALLTAGPRRLLDVRFAPDGEALYIADFGSMTVEDKPRPVPGTGVIWRVVREDSQSPEPPAGLSAAE